MERSVPRSVAGLALWRLAMGHARHLNPVRSVLERLFIGRRHRDRSMQPLTMRQATIAHRQKRILLLGLFGGGNYGNDGSLAAMVDFLRHNCPEAELTSVCINPAKVEEDLRIPGIKINWPGFNNPLLRYLDKVALKLPHRVLNVVRTITEVRRFDAVVIPGTGVLTDYRADPFGAPYWIFRWCVAARLCGARLSMVNIGAGPIERRLSRWMLTCAARSASYRSFRDGYSRDFVAHLGIDTGADQVYPDLAFMLAYRHTEQRSAGPAEPATVGIGVMSYNGWQGQARSDRSIYESYLSHLSQFVALLLRRGHRIRLLVGEITDEPVVHELKEHLHRKHGIRLQGTELADAPIHSLQDLMRQIAMTDIVVASRYHNVICALKLGRPVISISYTKKHDELMAQFGLAAFCQHIERLSAAQLLRQFHDLLETRATHEGRIAQRIAEFGDRLTLQSCALLQSILG